MIKANPLVDTATKTIFRSAFRFVCSPKLGRKASQHAHYNRAEPCYMAQAPPPIEVRRLPTSPDGVGWCHLISLKPPKRLSPEVLYGEADDLGPPPHLDPQVHAAKQPHFWTRQPRRSRDRRVLFLQPRENIVLHHMQTRRGRLAIFVRCEEIFGLGSHRPWLQVRTLLPARLHRATPPSPMKRRCSAEGMPVAASTAAFRHASV